MQILRESVSDVYQKANTPFGVGFVGGDGEDGQPSTAETAAADCPWILPRPNELATGKSVTLLMQGRPFESRHLKYTSKRKHTERCVFFLAETVGFEPTCGCPQTDFEGCL